MENSVRTTSSFDPCKILEACFQKGTMKGCCNVWRCRGGRTGIHRCNAANCTGEVETSYSQSVACLPSSPWKRIFPSSRLQEYRSRFRTRSLVERQASSTISASTPMVVRAVCKRVGGKANGACGNEYLVMPTQPAVPAPVSRTRSIYVNGIAIASHCCECTPGRLVTDDAIFAAIRRSRSFCSYHCNSVCSCQSCEPAHLDFT